MAISFDVTFCGIIWKYFEKLLALEKNFCRYKYFRVVFRTQSNIYGGAIEQK